jgi:hypothetical protein
VYTVFNRNAVSATTVHDAKTEYDAESAVGFIAAFGLERIQGYGEAFLHFETGSDAINYNIEEAYLRLQASDGLMLNVGRIKSPTGFMDFRSPAEFRQAANPFAFGSSPFPSLSYPADLVELAVYGNTWKVTGSVMPLAPRIAEVDPESPWFPRDRFPSQVVVPYNPIFTLHEIILVEPEPGILADKPSFQITGELALGSLEFIAGAYKGVDPETAYRIKLMTGAGGNTFKYDIFLKPERSPMQAAFAGASWTGDNIRIYGELSWSPVRYFSTVSAKFTGSNPVFLLPSWTFDAALGLNAYWNLLAMDFILEARHLFLDPEVDVIRPALASLGVLYARRPWLDGRFNTSLLAALTPTIDSRGYPDDFGYALAFSLGWQPRLETELTLTIPVFRGNPDSDLGRYAGMTRLALALSQKR